ncbi:uncharacterized protein [Nicotiana tomentosiformis]|uniref:uncharacterized protein n=1 Tax=Nicotiana tomentosiformis TaxID=4098 RepID=UPI00388C6B1E
MARGRGRGRGHARGQGRAQSRARAAAPVVEPQVDLQEEVPVQNVPVGPVQDPEGFIATPVLQDALVRLAALNVARKIEMVLSQERGQRSDKRHHQFDGFSGASSGGKGNFGRGHPPRPFHSALHASTGASGSHGPIMPYYGHPAFTAHLVPISAPPLQSYYSGYPVHLGQLQLQLQQPRHQDGCYECGNIGHIRKYCPRLASNKSRQDTRAIISAPVTSLLAQPARGRGQAAIGGGQAIRSGGQAIRGGGQIVRGGGQPVRGHPRDAVQSSGAQS